MEMHQIKYFLAVAGERHISRAAEKCHVSQPSLSRAIQKLEDEFGGALFERKPGSVELTELGRKLQPILQACFDQARTAKEAAATVLGTKALRLRIGIMATVFHPRIVEAVAATAARFPKAGLAITQGSASHLLSLLGEGELDLVIGENSGQQDECQFTFEPLYRERYALCLPATHRLAARDSVCEAEAEGEVLLDLHANPPGHLAGYADGDTAAAHRVSSQCIAHALVRSGIGCAILPEFSPPGVGVVMKPLQGTSRCREIGLTTRTGQRPGAVAETFVSALQPFTVENA